MAKKKVAKKLNLSWIKNIFSQIKKHPRNMLFIVLLDILFVVSLYGIAALFTLALPNPDVIKAAIPNPILSMVISFTLIILYTLSLLLAYTFFKFFILQFLHETHKTVKSIRKGFWKLFLINVIIAVAYFASFYILISVSFILNPSVQAFYTPIITILLGIVSYSIVMIVHSRFSTKKGLKTLKTSFSWDHFTTFGKVFLIPVIGFAAFYLLYYIVAIIAVQFNLSVLANEDLITNISGVVLYLLHFVARVGFFEELRTRK